MTILPDLVYNEYVALYPFEIPYPTHLHTTTRVYDITFLYTHDAILLFSYTYFVSYVRHQVINAVRYNTTCCLVFHKNV